MGAAERLPSASERDTETPEVERPAREPGGKARKRPEIPAGNRRGRRPLPEIVEGHRKPPSLTQRIGSSSRPRPFLTHATPPRPPKAGPRPNGNRRARRGEGCLSRRGRYVALLPSRLAPQPFYINWVLIESKIKQRV
ncbi:unnamed protein product [Pipistrellus nathusii]|uniref:Uncharacterized protein n=1 Tax=Pipistrellus nathusii TaxID=59473 RepID=A0ABN9ZP90_PIPNA